MSNAAAAETASVSRLTDGQRDQLQVIRTPSLQQLLTMYQQRGYTVRLVGGAVRDLLLGNAPKDIDLATDATPEETVGLARRLGVLHVIPTGLQHGTLTLHNATTKESFEVTTLRVDTATDGRFAEVMTGNVHWIA